MYADMGHFGRMPIRLAWFVVALPALVLNYFGQAALLMIDPSAIDNPFFQLAPDWVHYPLVAFAALATVIASQAIISGVFSLTQQSIQLGFLPRMHIIHTTSHAMGQIYVPLVNWLLAAATLGAVVGFGTSDALAGAYGIAVSLLMAITTLLAALVAIQCGYSPIIVIAVNGFFFRHRLRLLRRELDQVPRGRLVSAAARRRHRVPDADLAQRRQAGRKGARQAAAAGGGPDRNRRQPVPCQAAGHRRVPGVRAQGRAVGADAIRQAQSGAAPARGARHRGHRGSAPHRRRGPGGGDRSHRRHHAGHPAFWLHAVSDDRRRPRARQQPGQAAGDRPRRRHLLHRPRDHHSQRGRARDVG